MICPALNINITAKIIPKYARCARVLPPILTILRLRTIIMSIDKTKIKIPVIKSDILLVEVNGETNKTDAAGVPCLLVATSIGVGTGVTDGLGCTLEIDGDISFALATGMEGDPERGLPKN